MLRFIHIGDTHIGQTPEHTRYARKPYEYARRLVEFLNDELTFTPDFVVHTGDVTDFTDDESAILAAEVFSQLKYPIHYVIGNHDGVGAMRQYLLKQPRNEDRLFYDFHREDFHFVVLDTRGYPDPHGYISPDQLEWLQETCKASTAQSLVLLIHHLPIRMQVPWYDQVMEISNSADFFKILQPHKDRLRGMFFGHIHRALTGYREGILCSATNSAFMQFRISPHDVEPYFDLNAGGGYSQVTLTHESTIITHHTIPLEKGLPQWALIS